ncbi:MAG TPA: GTPase [Gammaproteobacteria bacterium]
MPANLSPEYKAAADALRRARDPEQRLEHLREMLRVIPKHKGTDHLQADLKRRIKELDEELAGPKKGGARSGPALVIRPEGAAQIALLGPPNSGKSALHARLTGSSAKVAPYPFTTQFPEPGMMPVDDIHLQLVDLPPLSSQHPVSWIGSTLQSADACLLVLDIADAGVVELAEDVMAVLAERSVGLTRRWPGSNAAPAAAVQDDEEDPFRLALPTLLLANKADLDPDSAADIGALKELLGTRFPAIPVSAETGEGLGELGKWLFRELAIVRVYTKAPGKPADQTKPFTLSRGQTVADVARLVHRELGDTIRFARLWGSSGFDGQQVGRDHAVADGDVVELHD